MSDSRSAVLDFRQLRSASFPQPPAPFEEQPLIAPVDPDESNLTRRNRMHENPLTNSDHPPASLGARIQNSFDSAFADLAREFASTAADITDDSIAQAHVRVARTLGLDSCALLITDSNNSLTETFSWTSAPLPFSPSRQFAPALPRLLAGAPVMLSAENSGNAPSVAIYPLMLGTKVLGASAFGSSTDHLDFTDRLDAQLRAAADFFANLLARAAAQREANRLREELDRLRSQLHPETLPVPRIAHSADPRYENIIGKSPAIARVIDQVEQVASTESMVLLTGETGTGKELFAQLIHDLSPRRGKSMVKVNCAALPPGLVESELFGRERGAYTGALTREIGRFELAHQSTIFLDELGELPLELQSKLLRVLQDGRFERVGNPKSMHVNVRVIAATNRDLKSEVAAGRFREDLYYRLNVFPIEIPPLRERPQDIPMLAWAFAAEFGRAMNKTIEAIPQQAMEALQRYPWPGNVRELRNVIERAVIVTTGPTLRVAVPASPTSPLTRTTPMNLQDLERQHILDVLRQSRWRVRGKGGAAEILGLKPTTLEARMAKLGISRNNTPPTP